ncbi:MAG: hypothetical protein JW967_06365 [Dehalococcoidales bacterium]|nr:hypothetical protein [Dehalococcoidales bacterium]
MGKVTNQPEKTRIVKEDAVILEDARTLARRFFPRETKQKEAFINRLVENYVAAKDKDTLIMHNPGGWGCTDIENLIDWERSVVEGFKAALTKMQRNWILLQYFRAGSKWYEHLMNFPEQLRYYISGKFFRAELLAAELNFLTGHINNLKIFLLGVSQGAAFGNTVMAYAGNNPNVFSIELGTFFVHMKRRVITNRTLAMDSNGLMPDPVSSFRIKPALKAYSTAPYRWLKYRLTGKPEKFTYCINVPGHEYQWEFPNVGTKIGNFLAASLGYKYDMEK